MTGVPCRARDSEFIGIYRYFSLLRKREGSGIYVFQMMPG
jgi:hypothetical protein